MNRKEILLVLTLAFVQFTHIIDGMIMMPMAPNLKSTLEITSQQFGFLVSSYGIAAFVSAIAATFWVDRFDRKKVLLGLYVGFLIGTLCCAYAPNYSFFLGARIFSGTFGGVAGAVILSIVGDVIPNERRARAMGVLMTGFSMASILGVPAGIYLSENFSYHAPFMMIVMIGVAVLFSIVFAVPPVTKHLEHGSIPNTRGFYRHVVGDKNMMRAVLFSFCNVVAHFAIIPYISDYFVFNMGFRMRDQIIWMYIFGGILSIICAPLIGKLADRFGRYKVYLILCLLAILPIYLISNFNSTSMAILLMTTSMFFIFSGGRMVPAQAMVTSAALPQVRGGFMSLNSAIQQLAIGITTLTGGLIISNGSRKELIGYEFVGYIGIAFSILTLIVGRRIKVSDHK